MKWKEGMYKANEVSDLPFFDIVFKTVAYSMIYNWYTPKEEEDEPEFKYMWYKGRNYDPRFGNWVKINYNQMPKCVRERFEEIKPLFYLLRKE